LSIQKCFGSWQSPASAQRFLVLVVAQRAISHLAVCALRLLAHLTVGLSRDPENTHGVVVLAVGLLVLTSAQPQWGFAWKSPPTRLGYCRGGRHSRKHAGRQIFTNRLQRAKLLMIRFDAPGQKRPPGLVAFAGTAFCNVPDPGRRSLPPKASIKLTSALSPRGTALAEAIETSPERLQG